MKRIATLALALGLAATLPAWAATEIGGVKFEDKAKLGAQELSFNGGGVRTRAFFKVYAMALYLPEKGSAADAVIAMKGAKRIHLVTLRDVTAQQFAEALVEGLQKNSSESEVAKLQPKIDEFKATLLALKEAPKGTVILIDYQPESGTRLVVNNEPKGKDVAGEDFHRALLKIWLGDKPVQQDLKEAVLGKAH